jgi:AcrR family transcriptional regulator
MPILDAALAFALTMLLVATVVSQTINLMRRLARTRRKRMAAMLKEYFESEIKPVVDREMHRLSDRLDARVTNVLSDAAGKLTETDLFHPDELDHLERVSTAELIEKIRRSKLGAELLTELNEEAKTIFDELGRRWDVVGDRFTESFRTHTRYWATAVALLLALALNIDSIFILDSYIRDHRVAEAVTARIDEIRTDAERAIDAARDTSATLVGDTLTFQRLEAQIDRLTQAGLPIGWHYYPHACVVTSTDPATDRSARDACSARSGLSGLVLWILGIGLTAGLAGLGAPFWYDAVNGVARIARLGRTRSGAPAGRGS